MKVLERDGQYMLLTDEKVNGFKGVLLAAKSGPTPDQVSDYCIAVNQLGEWKEVDFADVPDEWLGAFGVDAPATPAKPKRSTTRRTVITGPEWPTLKLWPDKGSPEEYIILVPLVLVIVTLVWALLLT